MPSPLWLSLLESTSGRTRRDHLCAALRQAITRGTLAQGDPLPASRVLAEDLGLSRITVEAAYGQLETEGYLHRRVGRGTFVAIEAAAPSPAPGRDSVVSLSARGRALVEGGGCRDPLRPVAFAAGSPDLRAFPQAVWQRLWNQRWRREGEALMRYGDPQGHPELRQAIAHYLAQSRGVRCTEAEVVVLTSSQQALSLLAGLLTDPGDEVWVEDPGYRGARTAFENAEARLVPVPVDAAGMAFDAEATPPRLVYLTPSHHYPTGVGLSLPRRMALLALAGRGQTWVLEDDYDGEFQYDGRPLPALQGLDGQGRVIYLGTFSKVLFPSLRLAYAVVPRGLVPALVAARTVQDGHSAQLAQAVTADFMAQGHFASHLRQMRNLYRTRRDMLLEGLSRIPWLTPQPSPGGLQLSVRLPPGEEAGWTRQAAAQGLATPGLSALALGPGAHDGWILGFSALNPAELQMGLRGLGRLRAPRG